MATIILYEEWHNAQIKEVEKLEQRQKEFNKVSNKLNQKAKHNMYLYKEWESVQTRKIKDLENRQKKFIRANNELNQKTKCEQFWDRLLQYFLNYWSKCYVRFFKKL